MVEFVTNAKYFELQYKVRAEYLAVQLSLPNKENENSFKTSSLSLKLERSENE